MPIALKHLKAKVKGTGGYVGFDTVSDGTTAERIAAIEEKGEEVLASIPSDYTALSEEVDDLAEALQQITVSGTTLIIS